VFIIHISCSFSTPSDCCKDFEIWEFFCSTSPLKVPNRLKSLKLAWRFVLTSCDIYQNPFTQEKILKFWQCRTKKALFRMHFSVKNRDYDSCIIKNKMIVLLAHSNEFEVSTWRSRPKTHCHFAPLIQK
jgi:hypothetical protein